MQPQQLLRQVVAHDRELAELVRFRVDVGARVEQDGSTAAPRHGHRESRSIDPGGHADHHLAGDQGGARIAGGHHGLGPAFLDQAGADAHR